MDLKLNPFEGGNEGRGHVLGWGKKRVGGTILFLWEMSSTLQSINLAVGMTINDYFAL